MPNQRLIVVEKHKKHIGLEPMALGFGSYIIEYNVEFYCITNSPIKVINFVKRLSNSRHEK